MIKEIDPDVLLVDIHSPQLMGWDLVENVRLDEKLDGLPVMIVSHDEAEDLSILLGAAGSIQNPIDWSRLDKIIQNLQSDCDQIDVALFEDSIRLKKLLENRLKAFQCSFRSYKSGDELFSGILEAHPQVLIVDLSSDSDDTLKFIESLRKQYDPKTLPLVAISETTLSSMALLRLEAVGSRWCTLQGSDADILVASIEELMALSLQERSKR